jgi:hypothetical protein
MALPTVNLDDRTYAQLVEILKSHLPEEWSDNNPSDNGMALMELVTWLGEMELYRMNRIPRAHRDKFLKLLVDPPVPVTVDLTMRLVPPRVPAPPPPPVVPPTPPLVLPPGLRFATDYKHGRRTMFESYQRTTLPVPPPGQEQTGIVRLRAVREFKNEELGVSRGTAHQVFPIANRYVLLDFENADPAYNPNPRVQVGVDEWELRSFLLTKESQASPVAPKHFMVEEFENQVRFGDGVFGAIPTAGLAVRLLSYQVLEGPEGLVSEGDVKHFLNPELVTGLLPGETLDILGNTDAAGGENFFPPEERIRRGLDEFRDPTRLVTSADFSRVVLQDFNAFQRTFNLAQGLPEETGMVQRAVALMNRKPPLTSGVVSPGHVTLLLLPDYDESAFEAASVPVKTAMVALPLSLQNRLLTFLEPRRLITTRLHVASVDLKPLSAQVTAVVERQMNTADMEQTILQALRRFLSLTRGYEDGRGWPLGRTVRRSQIYRVLEDVPGMDHVESLSLSPANASGDVELIPRQLPVWDSLVVQVKRA